MWAIGIYLYKVKLPWVLVAKVTFISVLASLTAHFIASTLPPLWGILCGGGASVVLLFALFYLLRVLKPEDRARFNVLIRALPARFAAPVNAVLLLLIRPEIDNAVTAKEFI
jgi:hypothetical protein